MAPAPDPLIAEIEALLARLGVTFGTVTLHVKAGHLTLLERRHTELPEHLSSRFPLEAA